MVVVKVNYAPPSRGDYFRIRTRIYECYFRVGKYVLARRR